MAQNKCSWVYKKNGICQRRCVGEYCASHNQQLKYKHQLTATCIKCNKIIRGKTKLCSGCGGKNYRSFVDYYRRRYNIIYDENDYLSGNYKKNLK